MLPGAPFQGSLFAEDFLRDTVTGIPDWEAIDDTALDELEADLRDVFERFPTDGTPNERQTEGDLIWPVLACLGWTASLRQQNLSARGREDVPDGLLFPDDAAKERANRLADDSRRYEHGLAIRRVGTEVQQFRVVIEELAGRVLTACASPSTATMP